MQGNDHLRPAGAGSSVKPMEAGQAAARDGDVDAAHDSGRQGV